ncbi:hypothetical protein [Xenorhabdus indica]|uniref:hypothetical protein n=1 Tax=Xenorhabdus indica TaxID=333964 RepID=UPI001656A37A|nr:hypothetical protein [Xenorhabdus indica]MBC8946809.1 hypothetical protein [Xenorhabdus indica]
MSVSYDARALAVEYLRRNKEELSADEYLVKMLEIEKAYSTYLEESESQKMLDTWATLGRES